MGGLQRELLTGTHCSENAVLALLGVWPRRQGKHGLEVAFKSISGTLLTHLRGTQSKVWRPKRNDRPNGYKIRHPTLSIWTPDRNKPRFFFPWGIHICKRKHRYIYISVCVCVYLYRYMYTLYMYIKSVFEIRIHSFQHFFNKYSNLSCL